MDMFNNIEIRDLQEFCKKYNIGLIINDGIVIKGENEKFKSAEGTKDE